MPKSFYFVVASLLLSLSLSAQSLPSAEGPGVSVWAGASVSLFNPDYGCGNSSPFSCWNHQLIGLGSFASTNSFLFGRIGAEGQAHFLRWNGLNGMTQDSYMGGPHVRIYSHHALAFSGKFLLGVGRFSAPSNEAETGTYFVFSPGATVNYRIARRLSARLDYDYQRWPSFKSSAAGHPGPGLTPNGFSLGLSYALKANRLSTE